MSFTHLWLLFHTPIPTKIQLTRLHTYTICTLPFLPHPHFSTTLPPPYPEYLQPPSSPSLFHHPIPSPSHLHTYNTYTPHPSSTPRLFTNPFPLIHLHHHLHHHLLDSPQSRQSNDPTAFILACELFANHNWL